jgi:hypothetical protein
MVGELPVPRFPLLKNCFYPVAVAMLISALATRAPCKVLAMKEKAVCSLIANSFVQHWTRLVLRNPSSVLACRLVARGKVERTSLETPCTERNPFHRMVSFSRLTSDRPSIVSGVQCRKGLAFQSCFHAAWGQLRKKRDYERPL